MAGVCLQLRQHELQWRTEQLTERLLEEFCHLRRRACAIGNHRHAESSHTEPQQAAMIVGSLALISHLHTSADEYGCHSAAAVGVIIPRLVGGYNENSALLEQRIGQQLRKIR